ncbi:hypothetical protein [Providencia hangzhouensis]|uniref:hypothetical protein n=1 Tax=Providencia hangzhouensis TaxID=3031799 RepID=UPI00397B57A3
MKKSMFNKAVLLSSLYLLSNTALSHEMKSPYSEQIITQCARYVIGHQQPNQSDKAYIRDYLTYFGEHGLNSTKISHYLTQHPKMLSSENIGQFITLLELERDLGVTLCATQTQEYLHILKGKFKSQ